MNACAKRSRSSRGHVGMGSREGPLTKIFYVFPQEDPMNKAGWKIHHECSGDFPMSCLLLGM